MNKKIITGITLGIIVIIVGVFIITNYFYGECKNTKTGWQCEFNDVQTVEAYAQKCENQNGKWRGYGDSYTRFCDFPFEDNGKECSNSKQCKGRCVVTGSNINCTDSCKGTCAKYPLRLCDWWYEVNNGVIEDHTGILCD